ncbi:PKD domain-containing protein [Pontibacter ruber]|uniref:PKD domain-containing protein n=1 Tax=Pontibacter ruber TaxID=1343895 RepID=A0ABW5CZH2_9BACT|nr:PKD domain-containing protein [Pontibacter ruber]
MKRIRFPFTVFIWITLLLSAGCGGDSDQDPTPNLPPVVNAGTDQRIYLPADTVELRGSGTDSDGSIKSYEWTKLSGPESYTIVSATAAATKVKNLVEGEYAFGLRVTDNSGLSDQDTVVVSVFATCPCAPNCDPIGDPCNPWDY